MMMMVMVMMMMMAMLVMIVGSGAPLRPGNVNGMADWQDGVGMM